MANLANRAAYVAGLIEDCDYVVVVSFPDYNGGRQSKVYRFYADELEIFEDSLKGESFVYIRKYTMNDLFHSWNKPFIENHYEPFHEEAYDEYYTLKEYLRV